MSVFHMPVLDPASSLRRRLLAVCVLTVSALAGTAAQAAAPSPPPDAHLYYQTKVAAKGMSLSIDSEIEWSRQGDTYRVLNHAQHMLLGNLTFDSRGRVTPAGLVPEAYLETRRKREKLVTIDQASKQVKFSGGQTAAAPAGLQDRTSVLLQLSSLARGDAAAFQTGKTLTVPVAGSSQVQEWVFQIVGEETLSSPMGKLRTVHVKRQPRAGRDGPDEQQVDVWLAPDRNWLPARVRLREANGDEFDQVVSRIEP
ncbi:DUF3108 domain-containing protein [Pigmentiphaga aceris]|uniref:DUF3108 domain-containing protein n=1 Tax=Pigmentiphaga aceris TaxID=1940612 RepID=A0A5C0AS21_9BURK|nr:DUF3108 domain-containing protein [Pigmentiphaga aceris]QEI04805.1 DUF3108 domain-containing protein [Pigmentiphaga aceris]